MLGDFSKWPIGELDNAVGPLQQQGRVLLDTDLNAQTAINRRWQDAAARAAFGAGVAAVSSDAPHAFAVTEATHSGSEVAVTLKPGQLWADGLRVVLAADPDSDVAKRMATPLAPPFQSELSDWGGAGTHDAVVLEVWREALNAFQDPERLLEPALGGPDTTERMMTAFALRLVRLGEGETCKDVVRRIADDFSLRGTLTASLKPTTTTGDPCPVVTGGGYSGLEHNLYRIEIAPTTAPMFKWSAYNGGLVGRGEFDSSPDQRVDIVANSQPILRSGLTEFYLEVLELDASTSTYTGTGRWQITYGAHATLGSDGVLTLTSPLFGTRPSTGARHFFRLWNGIEEIADFASGPSAPRELKDGIELEFAPPSSTATYVPGDYWTFPVRANPIGNPNSLLVDAAPPRGVHAHRVALAELHWQGAADADVIADCRHVFDPLTRREHCCTHRVGDGRISRGDFATIREALEALPEAGGRICILPGSYTESVVIRNRHNILITGCGNQTLITGSDEVFEGASDAPVFHIEDSSDIKIQDMVIEAGPDRIGVLASETLAGFIFRRKKAVGYELNDTRMHTLNGEAFARGFHGLPLQNITLCDLTIRAATRSAIDVRGGSNIDISRCQVQMHDVETEWPAITVESDDVLIERNEVSVLSDGRTRTHRGWVSAGLGGVWLRGGTRNARVVNNAIEGGMGVGILLGHVESFTRYVVHGPAAEMPMVEEADASSEHRMLLMMDRPEQALDTPLWSDQWQTLSKKRRGFIYVNQAVCGPCEPGTVIVPPPAGGTPDDRLDAGPPLEDIWIERNRIRDMGLPGIGVFGFFEDPKRGSIEIENLTILGNVITGCVARSVAKIPDGMTISAGHGAICLATVDTLTVRDNIIEDNGFRAGAAVSGVFVQLAEGADFSRNRIRRNGSATAPSRLEAAGIFIGLATASRGNGKFRYDDMLDLNADHQVLLQSMVSARYYASGASALSVADNEVSAPHGPALVVFAVGAVSVHDNRFVSYGPGSVAASTVFIMNLGESIEAGKWGFRGQYLNQSQAYFDLSAAGLELKFSAQFPAGAGLAQAWGGNVSFSDNQCTLDLTGTPKKSSHSSTSALIASLDDVGIHDNQFDCLSKKNTSFNLLAMAATTRCQGNRLKEIPDSVTFSGIVSGNQNVTTGNISTHCLLVVGEPHVKENNIELPGKRCKILFILKRRQNHNEER